MICMMLVPKKNFDLFDDFFTDPFFKGDLRPANHPMPMMKTDIRENEHNYIIEVDLPGYEKEDIKVDVEDGYLNINAKTSSSKNEEEKGKFIRRERFSGECSRSFYIGEEIEDKDIHASFDKGILKLEVPKKLEEYKEPEKKYIEIQ